MSTRFGTDLMVRITQSIQKRQRIPQYYTEYSCVNCRYDNTYYNGDHTGESHRFLNGIDKDTDILIRCMRKIYRILTAEIILAIIVAVVFISSNINNHWMITMCMFGTLGCLIALVWKELKTPTNYIILGVLTLLAVYSFGVVHVVTCYKVLWSILMSGLIHVFFPLPLCTWC